MLWSSGRDGRVAREMLRITRLDQAEDAGGALVASWLDPLRLSSPYSLKLTGWALRREGPPQRIRVTAVEPLADGSTLRRSLAVTPVNVRRPDVAACFPEVPGSELCGFRTGCSLLGLPRRFRLSVEAEFDRAAPVTVCDIEGTRQLLETGYRPQFQPILVRTLGRAGSTWLTHLVGAHPQALAYRPFDFEPRMLGYWLEVVRALSQPHSYAQAVHPDVGVPVPNSWWEGRQRSLGPLFLDDEPPMASWLEVESIEELAAFAHGRIDSFYRRVAQQQDKTEARSFVERCHEWHEVVFAHELYEGAREVYLVRDLRDILASRLAFNRATGESLFGYDEGESPEDYVRGLFRSQIEHFVQTWLARREDAVVLRYEDLVLRPRETLRNLFEHVGLDAGDGTVAGVLERAEALAPDLQARHRTSAGAAASIGRWRDDLSPGLQAACTETCGDALAIFGYEAD